MKILHTVQFYHPNVGGAQEVIRQISEQLARRGHEVTVATSYHPQRASFKLNGVQIEQFNISGNAVQGYRGEVERYQDFLRHGNFDVMMNYAAQQWATDLVFPELDRLPFKKVLIPCGFSALYDPAYADYFSKIPGVMRSYDHLIFHANNYRDTNFARQHGLTRWSIIPNGASAQEFNGPSPDFRQRNNIPPNVPILLTIGTHTALKGHRLVLETFRKIKTNPAVLILIGNGLPYTGFWPETLRPILGAIKHRNFSRLQHLLHIFLRGGVGQACLPECRALTNEINQTMTPQKKVFLLDLPRAEVVSALKAADLFVFGSNIEYSPIVLFEAMAAQTPFITLACGNAAEIVEWSHGGGILAPTLQKEQGYVDGDPSEFARVIDSLLNNPDQLQAMGQAGYTAWSENFTWEKLALKYEKLYQELIQ